MNPVAAVALTGGVLAAGAYLVAVLDGLFAASSSGGGLAVGVALTAPWRRAALLLSQRRTVTERPDAPAWALAPALLAGLAAVALAAVPFAPGLEIADIEAGIVLFGAAMLQVMVGVFLHGWSANSAFPLIGAYRFAAVALSFGIPFSLVIITTAIPAESLAVGEIIHSQRHLWNVVRQPLGLLVYLITAVGMAFWGPFRLPDGADLSGGTAAETSGAALAVWRLARAAVLVSLAAMGAAAFLGGHLGPWLPGWGWTAVKTLVLLTLMVWIGHRLPRMRVEWVVHTGWVVLLPVALVDVFVSGALSL